MSEKAHTRPGPASVVSQGGDKNVRFLYPAPVKHPQTYPSMSKDRKTRTSANQKRTSVTAGGLPNHV